MTASFDSDDSELMPLIAAADESAFQAFYQRHCAAVLALCLRILDDRQDAEDVLLDVFWEIWSKSGRYDASRGEPRSYLMLIARSKAIDRSRAVNRVRKVESQHRPTTVDAYNPETPLGRTLADEERRFVREALVSLDPKQREPIELAFFEGLSHKQISEHMGVPLGTIKTQIRRGLKKLAGMLRQHFRQPAETNLPEAQH